MSGEAEACVRLADHPVLKFPGLDKRCVEALRALLAATATARGSVSTVRSDDPPAKPLPTCGNCGSNFITPVPCDGMSETYDEVWRDRERLRERLDQFESYGFPNVAAVLDRVNAPTPDVPKVRLCACAWCGGALVQDPDATHRWRCINAEQRKCVARGDWYILDDDRDYIPAYPAAQPTRSGRRRRESRRRSCAGPQPASETQTRRSE